MIVVEAGDVIQIDLNHHWGACLGVVEEVTNWGVKAYVLIPANDGTAPAAAYIRLKWGDFLALGVKAQIVTGPVAEEGI